MRQSTIHTDNILGTEKIGRLIARFAVPSVIAMLVSSLYSIADQIFIGQGVGYLGNGATNVAFLLALVALSFSLLIGDGTAAYFSLRLGEGRPDRAAKGAGCAFAAICALAACALLIGVACLEPMLKLFGATDAILPQAMAYGQIVVFGLPPLMISTALNALVRADGSPKFAMLSMSAGAILNIALDPVFIFMFHWGVEGAALATVIGQTLSFLLSISYCQQFKCIRLTKADFRLDSSVLRSVCALGASSFIDQLSFTLVMAVNNNLLVHYGNASIYGGDIPLAAFGIAMKTQQILFAVALGIAVGMQPIVGYNYGARDYERVKKAFWIAAASAAFACLLGSLVLVFFPRAIIGLFGSSNDALYVSFSTSFFRIYFLFAAFLGFQTVAGIFFQAVGKPLKAAAISLSYQLLFRVAFAALLSSLLGLDGVLWSGPLSDVLAFLLALTLILLEIKQLNAKMKA